eukprot:30878-Rhodomonas_salina.4
MGCCQNGTGCVGEEERRAKGRIAGGSRDGLQTVQSVNGPPGLPKNPLALVHCDAAMLPVLRVHPPARMNARISCWDRAVFQNRISVIAPFNVCR